MGAAMRLMISLPVPLSTRIGSRPAMITATIMAFGRTRSTAPSRMASRSAVSVCRPASTRFCQACLR